jgi:Domain of Unknown Function with PDB structure (DUF3857)/Transglutaminase-like superfamily
VSLRRMAFTLSSVIALVSCSSVVLRAEGIPPIPPEELSMTSEPLAPGAPAVVLYRQVERDDRGLTGHEDNFVRIKILKEEGRKQADIEIPFYKEFGINVVGIKARTIHPDGSTINFEGKAFDKAIVKAKGLKYMAKTFTLPDVQVGSIIEYSYTTNLPEYALLNSEWILSNDLFTKHARFSLKPYTSDYSNWHVRWSWNLLPAGTTPPKEGPDQVIRMEASNIPAFQTEDFMPPPDELKSRVNFTYTEDFESKDAAEFWRKHGKKLNGAVESFVGKQKPMEQAVAQIVSPSDAPMLKLQKIYSRVQQLRNTSYEVEKTEKEQKRNKEKDNSNVEDIWKHGYGNGRELNWLFLALARAAGFDASSVFLSERKRYFFDPAMMDANKLDGDVVVVKVDGKDVFCDPGAAFTPFGLLQWPETAVPGLRLDKDGGKWIRTAMPQSADSRIVRKADLTVSETGDVEGKVTMTFTGLEALRWRVEERHEDETDRKKTLEDLAKEYIPAACEIELTNKPDWSNSSAALVAEFKLKIPGWVSGAGRRALLPVGFFSASEKQVFEQERRVHPIYFEFPSQEEDDVTLTLPAGWTTGSVPKAQNYDAKAALYSLQVDADKGTVHLVRKLNFDLLILDVKYYPALRNFFQAVRTGDEEQVVLQPGKASASY